MAAVEPEPVVEAEPVTAVAQEEEKFSEPEAHSTVTPAIEAAAAAAVGGAALAGAAHFFSVAEPAPVHHEAPAGFVPESAQEEFPDLESFASAVEEPVVEAPAEVAVESVVSDAPEAPYREPMGDAALAEELAAALAEKEAEAHVTVAADTALASAVEPAVAAAIESSSSEHMIADAKLSDAVSRALEKLRPQLIAEIMKELFK
jgi:hypothetical protein